ncbi:MAG: hypothetical protein K0R57_1458 [Paenibacillaceae bacterium]|nr:hypothetical protein [Paenibacillaceae bacterium]
MRKALSMILIMSLLMSFWSRPLLADGTGITADLQEGKHYVVLTADSFAGNRGNWTYSTQTQGGLLPGIMLGSTDQANHSTTPATAKYGIPADGMYKVMVHSRDYAASPGIRLFRVKLGDNLNQVFGNHGYDGWQWQSSGPLALTKGEYDLEALDIRGNYARFDMIIITDDLDFTIEDTTENLNGMVQQHLYVPGSVTNDPPVVDYHYIVLTADSFAANPGNWSYTTETRGSLLPVIMFGSTDQRDHSATPAVAKYGIPADGTYKVMVHSRDFALNPGIRPFRVKLGGIMDQVFGDHGYDGWQWQSSGPLALTKGEYDLEAVDFRGSFGRFDMIIITNDLDFTIEDTAENFNTMVQQHLYVPGTVTNDPPYHYIALTADSFAGNRGNWTYSTQTQGGLLPGIMLGSTDQVSHSTTPATAKYGIPADGMYKVMVHSRDYAASPGMRLFRVKLGDNLNQIFGDHGFDGWQWQSSGPLALIKGEYDLEALDVRGNYARFDMIIITDDLDFTIEDTAQKLNAMVQQHLYVPGSVTNDPAGDPTRPDVDIAVKLNNSYMELAVQPEQAGATVLLPFQAVFEALGSTVQQDVYSQTETAYKNGKFFKVTAGAASALINGKSVALDQPAVWKEGTLLVPLTFITNYFGAAVSWNGTVRTAFIAASIPKDAYLLRPESFQQLGTWTVETSMAGAFESIAMRGLIPVVPDGAVAGPGDADPGASSPATASFEVEQAGSYKLWVRSRDFASNQQGTRFFHVGVNGQQAARSFGTHGNTGFSWAEGGTVHLQEGVNTVSLYDTSGFYARCDAILLTKDLTYVPPEDYNLILKAAVPISAFGNEGLSFPSWALSKNTPAASMSIENDSTRVVFYKVNTDNGQVVQNEIYALHNGNWVKTKDRTEELGYLVMAADSAGWTAEVRDFHVFDSDYRRDGLSLSYQGTDIYRAGAPNWFVPVDYEVLENGSKLKLLFNNPLADFSAVWELEEDNKAPKVTVDAVFHQAGAYSIGAWEGGEFNDNQYEFALAPYRMQGKRIAAEAGLLKEQYLFTPMGTLTLGEGNPYYPGGHVTKGVAVEPSWIPLRWVYSDNGAFGIAMRGTSYSPKGSVFAPVLGAPDSVFAAGDSYTLQYRVISQVADWFEAYKYVAQDLFDVHDYRENVYTSLNDAIFNTRELIMDDELGGWDVYDKAHYNMEGKNVTSSANPLQALQDYLLTEDEEILERRAIPTIANFLTRNDLHFNRTTEYGGASYWNVSNLPHPIGSPIAGYNLNVIGGMYEMTRGAIPYLYQYGLQKGQSTVTNSYGSIPLFSNNLFLYKYTGDGQYLTKAKQQADQYLRDVVYKPQTKPVGWSDFIAISYYPNVASLVDLYEFTQEQKYLDAAQYAARWLTTTLWVPGIDGEKLTRNVDVNDIGEITERFHYYDESNSHFWWHGDEQQRVGRPAGNPGDVSSNSLIEAQAGQAPAWVASRVGLSLEQSSTYDRSANIIMSNWAGDLLKLSRYTGEKYLADVARNAIIGHFSTYSGYYQNGFTTFQQQPEYAAQGPDYTGIYWHHLPPFLAMLEDFLINLTYVWSDGQIEFPSLRQQGYAYFNSNQYGFAPGQFFGEEEMWLWLDEGIMESGHLQVDWLAARKDGVLGLALLNESAADITTEVTLGDKVPGGSSFSGTASIYTPGSSPAVEVQVVNGKFAATIPAKSLRAAVIHIPGVTAPAFSQLSYALDSNPQLGQTVSEHVDGKAMVLQMAPDHYYAYVYVTRRPASVSSVMLKYRVGDGTEETAASETYPYEFLIKVDDPSKTFQYELIATAVNGETEQLGGGELRPVQFSQP